MASDATALKDEGNTLFAAKDFAGAIEKFTEAIALEPGNHIFYSNRSGAFMGADQPEEAVTDAEKCISLNPTWGKGYSRLGAAWMGVFTKTTSTEDAGKAVAAFARGLAVEPTNASLTEGLLAAQRLASGLPPVKAAPTDEFAAEIIGIDLGTTYSCVGVWINDAVEIIANTEGARTTPSIVSFKDAERLVGQSAQAQAASNPSNTVFDAKRLIGRSIKDESVVSDMKKLPFKIVPGPDGETPLIEVEYRGENKTFSPEEISAMVLGKMKSTAEVYLGKPVNKAVITVPAYFNDAQRRATVSAGKIAGLEVRRIINEPTAAALAYGLDKKAADEARAAAGEIDEEELAIKVGKSKGKKPTFVLIFDLGGGTFDVSLLTIEDGIFEVKATGGDTHLGGEDFDQRLMDFCITEFLKKVKVDKNVLMADKRAMRRLRTACERSKRMLSSATQSAVEVESFHEGNDLAVTLTRAKFESLNADLFQKCIDTVKACMKDAKANVNEVGDIVLVGGSTRIPKVQTMLSEFFGGKPLCNSVHPDEAVAYGAAVQGAILAGSRSAATQSIVLVDVTPLSLGIETEGGTFATIIKRNTSIPVRKSKTFSTVDDYQDAIDVEVYEGERPMVEGNNHLGHFRITGIERAKRGEPQIEVTFDLDTNGVLTVSAQDLTTRVKANIQIANALGHLQPEDIERMTLEAMRMEEHDKARLAVVEARMSVEQLVYYVKEAAVQRDSQRLKKVAEEATKWVEEGPGSEEDCPLGTFLSKKSELDKALSIRDAHEEPRNHKTKGKGGR